MLNREPRHRRHHRRPRRRLHRGALALQRGDRRPRHLRQHRCPIVSAVGHETDFTISDFVADVRAPTPSAAAEMVAPDRIDISRRIESAHAHLAALRPPAPRPGRRLSGRPRAPPPAHRPPRHRPPLASASLRSSATAASSLARTLDQRSERVNACGLQLRSLDPHATLERGYAVVQLRDGKQAITSVAQVKGKEKLDIHVRDGKFPAEVSRQYGF